MWKALQSETFTLQTPQIPMLEGNPIFPCYQCGRTYKAKRSLWRHHKYECQRDPKFQCPICTYKAKQKCTVVAHVCSKHPDVKLKKHEMYKNQWRFEEANCDVENIIGVWWRNQSKDYAYPTLSNNILKPGPYVCTTCGRPYKAKSSLWRHMTRECQKEPTFGCNYCSYKAFQKIHVLSHIKTRHRGDKTIGIPTCSICHKIFRTRSAKCLHEKYICQKSPTFFCEYCPRNFYIKTHLVNHLKRQHGLTKIDVQSYLSPYECTTCGKHYKAKSTLWRHSTGECQKEPRYACQYCSYRSFQEIHLISHIKNQHLPADDSNKPSCSICHKIFNTRSAKCLHEKYRCQKSPMFSCQYCPLKFYLKSCWVGMVVRHAEKNTKSKAHSGDTPLENARKNHGLVVTIAVTGRSKKLMFSHT
ncbi:hypothetical protein GWI33_012761 [Rhynchophorus ferrugineus]|uniref:C2H2-type domain-containing protein n=1 Tax=Rhynchophorus ferrugineus TaxID=354439 RepID=A0A834IW73_RHYFE|nr:hypothetical protein GWI33_012761 [Rhynchophorus ferrugineus]